MKIIAFFLSLCLLMLMATSCGKGYQVRVSNYNTEVLDSVIIGSDAVVFKEIEKQATTDYNKIKSGNYTVKLITKSKNIYNSSIDIPKKGGGKRTIQIDGINAISILEE